MNKIQEVWANYKKPTPPKYRKIGDFALLMIPVIQTGLANAPVEVLSDHAKFWIGFVSTIVLTMIKFGSNAFKEPEENLSPNLES